MGKTLAFWFSILLAIGWCALDLMANTGNVIHMGQDVCAILSVIGLAVGIHIHLNLGMFSINTDNPDGLLPGMPQIPSKPVPVASIQPAQPTPNIAAVTAQMVTAHSSLVSTLAQVAAAVGTAATTTTTDPPDPPDPTTQSTDPTKPNYVPVRLT
jgi:hypothetical protein